MFVSLVLWLAFAIPRTLGRGPAHLRTEEAIVLAGALMAYGCAFRACRAIAAEYERGTWMRTSWQAFAACAAFCIARHLADNSFPALIWPGYWEGALVSVLRQSTIVLAHLGLLTGIVTYWLAFRSLGLGFRILPRDIAVLGVITLLLAGILCFREDLTEAQSPSRLAWYLQMISHVLLAAAAAAVVLTNGLCAQMGGGRLAATLRWILIYTLTRAALVFKWVVLPAEWNNQWAVSLVTGAVFYSVPWFFALATVLRSRMAEEAGVHYREALARPV
jgi:hypothetical protein